MSKDIGLQFAEVPKKNLNCELRWRPFQTASNKGFSPGHSYGLYTVDSILWSNIEVVVSKIGDKILICNPRSRFQCYEVQRLNTPKGFLTVLPAWFRNLKTPPQQNARFLREKEWLPDRAAESILI